MNASSRLLLQPLNQADWWQLVYLPRVRRMLAGERIEDTDSQHDCEYQADSLEDREGDFR